MNEGENVREGLSDVDFDALHHDVAVGECDTVAVELSEGASEKVVDGLRLTVWVYDKDGDTVQVDPPDLVPLALSVGDTDDDVLRLIPGVGVRE